MSNADTADVLVVGASLGGLAVAENLRWAGYAGSITLVGDEPDLPYDRPPLSKEALGSDDFEQDAVVFHPQEWYDEQRIALELGSPAVALEDRTVTLASGRTLHGEQLVLATGMSPRALPGVSMGDGVHELRTRGDAARLAGRLASGPGRIVILGAGFIGLEVAAAALSRGWEVQIFERAAAPLVRVLPPQLADVCWRAYETAGVALSCESTVVQVTPHPGGGHVVQTDDGRETTADSVVVALGGVPNSGWLSSSGLSLGDGIDCDEHGRTSIDGVFAVGDVARWHNNFLGRPQRVEQWESAREHALVVSRQILGVEGEGLSAPPYFWSDLLAGRVQFAGWYDAGVDDVWNFTDERGRVLALTGSGDRLSGVFTSRFPRAMARGRDLLRDGASLGEALTWAEATLPAVVPDMV